MSDTTGRSASEDATDSFGCPSAGCDATDEESCQAMADLFALKTASVVWWAWDLVVDSGLIPVPGRGPTDGSAAAEAVWGAMGTLVFSAAEYAYCYEGADGGVDEPPGDFTLGETA